MFSKVIRRTHMYLALSLSPWMLMYALSTMSMNHRTPTPPRFETEREMAYAGVFPAGASAAQMADQILVDLGLEGAHNIPGGQMREGRLTVFRQDLVTPRRITYVQSEGKITIERMIFRSSQFLERFHRRRGFQHRVALDDVWAVTVDLVIVAMVFWVLSGLWMWWEMKVTRAWGAVFALFGAGLFAFFLVTI